MGRILGNRKPECLSKQKQAAKGQSLLVKGHQLTEIIAQA